MSDVIIPIMAFHQSESIRILLREPVFLRPVIRRAIKELTFAAVFNLAQRAIEQYGQEHVNGRLRTRGGIFLRYLKQHPKKSAIFCPRRKRQHNMDWKMSASD